MIQLQVQDLTWQTQERRLSFIKGTALLKTFNVPTNGEGTLWQVFTIKNGNEIIPSNVFSYKTSSMDVGSDD